jgi:hypothetical protein
MFALQDDSEPRRALDTFATHLRVRGLRRTHAHHGILSPLEPNFCLGQTNNVRVRAWVCEFAAKSWQRNALESNSLRPLLEWLARRRRSPAWKL